MNFCQTLQIELIKIIPFLIIGGITVYIAYRQYKIEKTRLQSIRFEQRNNILIIIDKYCQGFYQEKPFGHRHYNDFHNRVLSRRAFFSEELCKKIDDLEFALYRYQFDPEHRNKKREQYDRSEIIELSKEILEVGYTESKIL